MAWFVVVVRDGESNEVILEEFTHADEAKLYALSEAKLRETDPRADHVRITVGQVQDGEVGHLGQWSRTSQAGWSWRDGEE